MLPFPDKTGPSSVG